MNKHWEEEQVPDEWHQGRSGLYKWYWTTTRVAGEAIATYHQVEDIHLRSVCRSISKRPKWCKRTEKTKIYRCQSSLATSYSMKAEPDKPTQWEGSQCDSLVCHSRSTSICPLWYRWQSMPACDVCQEWLNRWDRSSDLHPSSLLYSLPFSHTLSQSTTNTSTVQNSSST